MKQKQCSADQQGSEFMNQVAEHVERHTLHEIVITPDHSKRTESPEFRAAKERLLSDGHYECWVCGIKEHLQLHHHGAEWSMESIVDFDKLKAYCEEFDPYGYGKLMRNLPMTTVDDPRNLLWLCQPHHTGVDHTDGGSGTGIHELSYPVFLIQKIGRVEAVPQAGETIDQAMKDVKEHEEAMALTDGCQVARHLTGKPGGLIND